MYYPKIYKSETKSGIEQKIKDEGFAPQIVEDAPNFVYETHTHPETAVLAFLEGDMEVVIDKEKFHCTKGDKVIIPGNTPHSGVVGKQGCTYFWSEKLV